MLDGMRENRPAVEAATDALVMAATGKPNVEAAWKSLVKPTDRVGIKVSAGGGRGFATHRGIVDAVVRGLGLAGVRMSQVVIWDRAAPEEAGYVVEPDGPGVRSIEAFTGYDPRAAVMLEATGKLIWGDVDFRPHGMNPLAPTALNQYSAVSHWSRLICGLTKIVNIPVMAASEDCGVAGCIYNVTVPNVDNWRRLVAEPGHGNPLLCELYADPHAGPKVVLNIMDGLIAQYGGGPDWEPNYCVAHGVLYAGRDAVAIDAVALRKLDGWRKQAKLPPVAALGTYLETAQEMGLGICDENRIDLEGP